MTPVGTVHSLHIYPVKSMRGIEVAQASLYWYGFNGDRKYAFVRSGNPSGFPWLTGREVPTLLLYQPYFTNPAEPLNSAIRVINPAGQDHPLHSPQLHQELEQAYGQPIHLSQLSRGTFDCMPVSLISTTTVDTISQTTSLTLTSQRFRANILITLNHAHEDNWAGHTLTFGNRPDSAHVQVNYPTRRCAMINLDPNTAQRNPHVLKTVGQTRNTCAGMYGTALKLGTIQTGDPLFLTS